MFTSRNRRSGFTLPEVLVTVAIVAVLAAVVVPAVTQQVSKGDAPSFLSSVQGLRTSLTSFTVDVRKLPGAVSQLGNDIDNTMYDLRTPPAVTGTQYTTPIADRWRGPYESSGSSTGLIAMGFGWTTTDAMVDSLGFVVVTLTKNGAVIADATELDNAVDGGNTKTTGLIRWVDGASGALGAGPPTNAVKLFLTSSAR